MARCFIIQPFDKGDFDNRYEDLIVPAVTAAGLDAYRVDRDPNVTIPIEDIESGIRVAAVCLADISEDNPNVWFELGYAISANKDVVLICSDARSKFPFDVQHRKIIRYRTGSQRDFDELKNGVTQRLTALLKKDALIEQMSAPAVLNRIEGLDSAEMIALAIICENVDGPGDYTAASQVRQDLDRSGITKIASTIALRGLVTKGLVISDQYQDGYNTYIGYYPSDEGWTWLMANKSRFTLRKLPAERGSSSAQAYVNDIDDEIPF